MRNYEDVAEEIIGELAGIDFRKYRAYGEKLADKLPAEGPIYLVYDFENVIPAASMYWTLATLKPDFNVKLVEVQSFLSLLAPYTHKSHIILAVDSDKYTVQLRDCMNILNNIAHVVTSNPDLADKIGGDRFVVANVKSDFSSLTCKTVTLIAAGLALVKGESERRTDRMLEEISTLNDVLADMLTYYRGQVEGVLDEPDYVIASEPLRHQVERAYRFSSNIISWSRLEAIPPRSKVHVWKTSLEDHAMRELVRKRLSSGIEVSIVDFKTDPISAQLYSLVISEVTRRLRAQ